MFLIECVSDLKWLKGYGFSIEIINVMTNFINETKIQFNTNLFLSGFVSIVYNLRDGAFRKYKPDDYISMSFGFDINRENTD